MAQYYRSPLLNKSIYFRWNTPLLGLDCRKLLVTCDFRLVSRHCLQQQKSDRNYISYLCSLEMLASHRMTVLCYGTQICLETLSNTCNTKQAQSDRKHHNLIRSCILFVYGGTNTIFITKTSFLWTENKSKRYHSLTDLCKSIINRQLIRLN